MCAPGWARYKRASFVVLTAPESANLNSVAHLSPIPERNVQISFRTAHIVV